MEGEWSCYRSGKFNGGSGHVTEVARLRENGHVTEVVFNGGSMIMLQRRSVYWSENGHVTEVATLNE